MLHSTKIATVAYHTMIGGNIQLYESGVRLGGDSTPKIGFPSAPAPPHWARLVRWRWFILRRAITVLWYLCQAKLPHLGQWPTLR